MEPMSRYFDQKEFDAADQQQSSQEEVGLRLLQAIKSDKFDPNRKMHNEQVQTKPLPKALEIGRNTLLNPPPKELESLKYPHTYEFDDKLRVVKRESKDRTYEYSYDSFSLFRPHTLIGWGTGLALIDKNPRLGFASIGMASGINAVQDAHKLWNADNNQARLKYGLAVSSDLALTGSFGLAALGRGNRYTAAIAFTAALVRYCVDFGVPDRITEKAGN